MNCAHRMANLREVDFFPRKGVSGRRTVVLDAKIQRKGHKLFIDPSNVMPHRRRRPFKPYMKQMRNYGYTRMVANKRWPEIATWSHTAIGFFPQPSWCSPSPPCSTADCPRRRRSRPLVHARRDWDLARGLPHPPRHGEFLHRPFMAGSGPLAPHPSPFHRHGVPRSALCVPCAVGLRSRRHQGVARNSP